MDEINKYIETSLKYRLGLITEAPKDEDAATGDTKDEEPATVGDSEAESGGEDLFSQEDIDAAAAGMDSNKETPDAAAEDEGEQETSPEGQETATSVGDTGDQPVSDQQKVRDLFSDSGDPKVDYSLTADSNIRLARFKFKYAGIDPISMMTDDEKRLGVRADELESRLTPDQYKLYTQKNSELRKEFPEIASRERKVIIYNSNIPIFYNDENGVPRVISHKKDLSNAMDKIEKFMNKSFGDDWVDNKKSIKFIQGIKINFSNEKKVRPNLIPMTYFQPQGERGVIAFNKLYSDIPQSIEKFIKDNIESEEYKKSPLFRTFINDYTGENGEGSARISVYPVIMDPAAIESETDGESIDGEMSGEEDAGGEPNDANTAEEGDDTGDTGGDLDLGGGL